VWAVLRDFNSHVHWHPVVSESHIEDGLASDQVGCVRNFRLADGAHLREQLLALPTATTCRPIASSIRTFRSSAMSPACA
jgi:hypothetical protein